MSAEEPRAEAPERLWVIPTIVTIGAVLLAVAMLLLDRLLQIGRMALPVPFEGGVAGAHGVLTAIASSAITVTGILALALILMPLAPTSRAPYILHNIRRDRSSRLALGVLIGTFTYSLIVLRSVRSQAVDGERFVPALSVGVAIVLALAGVGLLISLIPHMADALRVSAIVERVAKDTLRSIERQYPHHFVPEPPARPETPPKDPIRVVTADVAGYVSRIDVETLEDIAEERGWQIKIELAVGDLALPGQPLATVWPAYQLSESAAATIRHAFELRRERAQPEVERGIRVLVDVAIHALSPGGNDPTTGTCLDRIAEVLVSLGNRDLGQSQPTRHRARVHGPRERDYEDFVRLAIQPIRQAAIGHPAITVSILETLAHIAPLVPPEQRFPLGEQAIATLDGARHSISVRLDRERIESAGRRALEAIGMTEGMNDRPLLRSLSADRGRRA